MECGSVLCDELEGWDFRGWQGGSRQRLINVYLQLICIAKEPKWTQHCKARIFQLKKIKTLWEQGEKKIEVRKFGQLKRFWRTLQNVGGALCLGCSLGPRVHNVPYFLGSVAWGCVSGSVMAKGVDLHSQALSKGTGQSQAPCYIWGVEGSIKTAARTADVDVTATLLPSSLHSHLYTVARIL